MAEIPIYIIIMIALGMTILMGMIARAKVYQRPGPQQALVVSTSRGTRAVFDGALVLPIWHRAELMDLADQPVVVERRGGEGLYCKDGVRVDVRATFVVRVNDTEEDVLRVAQSIGCRRASDQETLHQLLGATFEEAIKTAAGKFGYGGVVDADGDPQPGFIGELGLALGDDLNGYFVSDLTFEVLEPTALEHLDPDNILDARAIRALEKLQAEDKKPAASKRQRRQRQRRRSKASTSKAPREETLDAIICVRCHKSTADHDTCKECSRDPILDKRYALLEMLGNGASGFTWRARDLRGGGKDVAIKELSFRQLTDMKAFELFEREARILEALRHKSIPRYIGDTSIDEERHVSFFLVQELIDGEVLDLKGSWTDDKIIDFLGQMAEVLVYLSERRPPVIHRDIKPSNIMRRADGSFVLIDFGSTRVTLGDTVGGSTVAGTFGYMAPEQLRGQAGPAADIYGLGATALALLSGRDASQLVDHIDPGKWRSRVKARAELLDLLERMLEPRASKRLSDPKELRRRIEELGRSKAQPAAKPATPRKATVEARSRVAPRSSQPTQSDSGRAAGSRTVRWVKAINDLWRSPVYLIVAPLLGLLGLVGIFMLLMLVMAGLYLLALLLGINPSDSFSAPDFSPLSIFVPAFIVMSAASTFLFVFGPTIERRVESRDRQWEKWLRRGRWARLRLFVREMYFQRGGWGWFSAGFMVFFLGLALMLSSLVLMLVLTVVFDISAEPSTDAVLWCVRIIVVFLVASRALAYTRHFDHRERWLGNLDGAFSDDARATLIEFSQGLWTDMLARDVQDRVKKLTATSPTGDAILDGLRMMNEARNGNFANAYTYLARFPEHPHVPQLANLLDDVALTVAKKEGVDKSFAFAQAAGAYRQRVETVGVRTETDA